MGLRTPEQYLASLRDDRTVYFRGERVADVTTHPVIGRGAHHAAAEFAHALDPDAAPLAIAEVFGEASSRYYLGPRDPADLAARAALIEASTRDGHTVVPLVKEIGSDAIFALARVAAGAGDEVLSSKVEALWREAAGGDLALAVAQTDAKGDRGLGPSRQPNPDAYLRVVDRTPHGIVVRGAKLHTSCSPYVNEIVVLPTRAMSADDADWAVSFRVPVATRGLSLVASPFGDAASDPFEAPISSTHAMIETVTIFDDVFVPDDAVFLAGAHHLAGPLALAFVDYHRFTAISYKLPLVDALVGTAFLLADMNGIDRAGHVREKLTWLIAYAETLRALVEVAAARGRAVDGGLFVPDPLTVNIAKSHFAHGYHTALQHVQDISGGLLVTAPSGADLAHHELGPLLHSYLVGRDGHSGEERLRALWMASDLTTGALGGYHAVLAIHAEGSLEAEKLQTFRAYDARAAIDYARRLAGLGT